MVQVEQTVICMISLGCPKNLVDSEIMIGKLKAAGFQVGTEPACADVIVVNTCGFIDSAKEEAIQTILEMAEYKNGRCKALIATGCLAQRYAKDMLQEMPEVDFVLGTGSYQDIVFAVKSVLGQQTDCRILRANLGDISYLNEERVVSTSKSYAYLKIAEGCDNRCTYCIIPFLRGPYRSREKEDILKEATFLIKEGYKEIILVAQDTTRYGTDLYGKPQLAQLLREICAISGDFRVRIMYSYPDEITDELVEVMASTPKLCHYMDIPVQHGSDNVLTAMGRRSLSGEIKEKIALLRSRIPDLYIRTSLIVGFPGETEEDYEILKDFVKEVRFDRLGVFEYSKEEGTKAAKMPGQILQRVKRTRRNGIMKIQQKISKEMNEKRLGKEYTVIVEGISDDGIFYYGRTFAEAPDIDGLVYFTARNELQLGDAVLVKILNVEEYDLIGEQVDELTE